MLRRDAQIAHLKEVSLFSNLNRREVGLIAREAEDVTVPPGRVVVEEGAQGDQFFMILEGQAEVLRGGRKIAMLGPGQYFGEMAMLDGGPRSATVRAETDLHVLVLGQRQFTGVLDQAPGLARKLLATMAFRLRQADRRSSMV